MEATQARPDGNDVPRTAMNGWILELELKSLTPAAFHHYGAGFIEYPDAGARAAHARVGLASCRAERLVRPPAGPAGSGAGLGPVALQLHAGREIMLGATACGGADVEPTPHGA
jgi:hypothetical protein